MVNPDGESPQRLAKPGTNHGAHAGPAARKEDVGRK